MKPEEKNGIPCISIVMPVYNGEKYIKQAIESVMAQDFKFWELIIVDDGSTDMSYRIIEKYLEMDNRIHCIRQENCGEFGSRLSGIRNARGAYITGLDQDDCIDVRFLSNVYSIIEQTDCDCVATAYKSFGDSDLFFSFSQEDSMINGKDFLARVLEYNCPSFWGKIIKAEIYKSIDYSAVPKEIGSSAEDYLMTIPAICECKTVFLCKNAILYYRDYENSYSHKYTPKVIEDLYNISQYGIDTMYNRGILDKRLLRYEYISLINSVVHRILRVVYNKSYKASDFIGIYMNSNYIKSEEYENLKYLGLLQYITMRLFRKKRIRCLHILSYLYLNKCM